MSMGFKDLFSKHSGEYAKYRPTYPAALFDYLAALPAGRESAWDCGTGNGQAAGEIASRFEKVIATDASEAQLSQAKPRANIEFRVARADSSGLPAQSVDLVTVAQAFHWFKAEDFFAEARRVAKPGAAIALWCYGLCTVTPEIDKVMAHYYEGVIGPYWEPERKLVDEHYRTIEFPFQEVRPPRFNIELDWSMDQMLGYLSSWSATQIGMKKLGANPVERILPELEKAWGPRETQHHVKWELGMRVGKI